MKNFWYLFAAYSVVWVGLFAYIYTLYSRQQKIQQELDALMHKLGSPK
jgi:CcmD family protein